MSSFRKRLVAALGCLLLIGASCIPMLVAARPDERSLTIYSIHTKETVSAVFKRNGRYVPAGLKQLSHAMRDHRRDEATDMDPALLDLLWQVHSELGSREPIHLISGYRSRATNAMLRKTVGGQASESRHILGKAADVHFPDVPLRKIRYSALIQERGGVGYYPTSALPFVHLDTDRVRSWPRLPRHELALLFPGGTTRHLPTDGVPISRDDARAAHERHRDLAQQVASFHSERLNGGARIAIAEAQRPVAGDRPLTLDSGPRLVERPKIAARAVASPFATRVVAAMAPSNQDRARLDQLASLASVSPQLVSGPQLVRRPVPGPLESLTGSSLPAPPPSYDDAHRAALERQVASLGAVPLPPLSDGAAMPAEMLPVWIPAPAYDDEHPDELSYRPFAIGPYMTETIGEPFAGQVFDYDSGRTADLLDQPDGAATLGFVAGQPFRQDLAAFSGSAVAVERLGAIMAGRAVVTRGQVRLTTAPGLR